MIASASAGVPIARSYELTNLFGPFVGRGVGTTLGSARTGRFSIGNLEQQQYPVTVGAGSTSLRATIGNPSDPGADLDLFVFNCTTGSCVLAGQNADGDSEESVTINNPAAGLWIILIDGFAVPAGTTDYDYVDVFTNPAFGSVSITDANAFRPSGAVWSVGRHGDRERRPGGGSGVARLGAGAYRHECPGRLRHGDRRVGRLGAWASGGPVPVVIAGCDRGRGGPMILGMSEVSLRRVGPDEWQDRRGYGVSDAVVREVLDWARDQRFGRVDLWVLENNQAARRLYRRHGFVDTGSYMPYPYAPHRGCASNR